MSNQGKRNEDFVNDHPLFQTGVFHSQNACYHPVIDAISVKVHPTNHRRNSELCGHEANHRVFSVGNVGFVALRFLGLIGQTLLVELIGETARNKRQLSGKSFETLGILHPYATSSGRRRSYQSPDLHIIRQVEKAYYNCCWGLTPAAEIAAIDLTHGDGDERWVLKYIREKEEDKKIDEITRVANRIAEAMNLSPAEVQKHFLTVWKAYTTIKEGSTRHALLDLAANSVVKPHPTDPYDVISMNPLETLDFIYDHIPDAHQPGAKERFYEISNNRYYETLSHMNKIAKRRLYRLDEQLQGADYGLTLVDTLLQYSFMLSKGNSSALEPFPPNLQDFVWITDPSSALLKFYVNRNRSPSLIVNVDYLTVVERKLGSLLKNAEVGIDWWQESAYWESVRQSLKSGKPVVCPFQGIFSTCDEKCAMREIISLLKEYTDLEVREDCRISRKPQRKRVVLSQS